MNENHKEFVNAKLDEGDEHNYVDREMRCILRFGDFMLHLPLEQITLTHSAALRIHHQLDKLRCRAMALSGPASDHELDDMFDQLTERIERYEKAAFSLIQQRTIGELDDPQYLARARRVRDKERQQWDERKAHAKEVVEKMTADDADDPY